MYLVVICGRGEKRAFQLAAPMLGGRSASELEENVVFFVVSLCNVSQMSVTVALVMRKHILWYECLWYGTTIHP